MNTITQNKLVAVVLIMSLALGLCGGCNEGSSRIEFSPVTGSALLGALIGGIAGNQSDELAEGAAIGAGVFGFGAVLVEMDHAQNNNEHWNTYTHDADSEHVIVDVHNDNGSITPVKIKKKDGKYIGPKGERYEELPTEEQLTPVYGI